MDHNVMNALSQITREKNIDKAVIIESLEAGLQSAARKKLGAEANIDARINLETGQIEIEQVKTVVIEIDDPDTDIALEEAQIEFGDEVEVGDEVVLLGAQGKEEITADEWAELLGTIVYEIVCGFGPRIPRRYHG